MTKTRTVAFCYFVAALLSMGGAALLPSVARAAVTDTNYWSWDERCYKEAMVRFPEFTEEGAAGRDAFIRRCRRFATVLSPTVQQQRAAGLPDLDALKH